MSEQDNRQRSWRAVAAALSVAVLALGACGGNDDRATSELRPADDLATEPEEAQTDSSTAALGERIELGEGVSVVISDPKVGSEDGVAWLEVAVRAENDGAENESTPAPGLVCAGDTEDGGYLIGSTYSPGEDLPVGSFREGRERLLPSGDEGSEGSRPECDTPAVIRVWRSFDYITVPRGPSVVIPVPDELVVQLNSLMSATRAGSDAAVGDSSGSDGFTTGDSNWPDTGEIATCASGSLQAGTVLSDETLRADGFCGTDGVLPFAWVVCTDGRFLVVSPAGPGYAAAWWFRGEPVVIESEPPQGVLDGCLGGDEMESETGEGRLPI